MVSQYGIARRSLTAILICRFLLALHSANAKALVGPNSHDSQGNADGDHVCTSLRFTTEMVHSMRGIVTEPDESMLDNDEFERDEPHMSHAASPSESAGLGVSTVHAAEA